MSGNKDQLSFEIYEKELLNPLRGHELTPAESFISSALLDTSQASPLTNADLRKRLKQAFDLKKVNARTIKSIIRSLRKNHHFPILASFKPPYGYWWCRSAKEMVEYYKEAEARLKDEWHTLSQLIRVNFPEYAGQLRLEE
jgi:hypothetical protein